ncbi:MAG: DUF5655 domain-containing protein [Dehalococcoidia bacterium]
MSDLKLFRLGAAGVSEIRSQALDLEKSLQTLMESNLEVILGVRFLATEHVTGKTHGGRIDTLGIDENGCPVIIEYKRAINENVINQGLFYLDWLLDHRAEFELLVLRTLGQVASDSIDWSGPRLLCIASDFTRYDIHAVQQINRNIELIRYRRFGDDLLALELVNAVTAEASSRSRSESAGKNLRPQPTSETTDLLESLRAFLMALGDDVQEKQLKLYTAYKRLRNFVCVEQHREHLRLHVKLDPDSVELVDGFTRDVRAVGHWGTGDLEIVLRGPADFERAKPLLLRAYEDS